MTNNKQNLIKWLWLVYAATLAACGLSLYGEQTIQQMDNQETHAVLVPSHPSTATNNQTRTPATRGQVVNVSAFSAVECRTVFCRDNADKPRGQQVAVNKRFGKVSKVYIAAFDKFYTVIGSTDQNTDVDIWFASDYQGAKQFGYKQLRVNFIP